MSDEDDGAAVRHPGGWVVGVLAGLVAAALLGIALRRSILLDSDSATYLWEAGRIRADPGAVLAPDDRFGGAGRFPPGYSTLLAVLGGGTGSARVLGVACAALATGAVVELTRRRAGLAAAVAVAAVLLSTRGYLVRQFGFAMADGPYTPLLVGTAIALDVGMRATSRCGPARWIGAATAFAAAASLLRVTGTCVVLAVAAAVWAWAPTRRRARAAALVAVTGLLPIALWQAATALDGRVADRPLGIQPLGRAQLAELPSGVIHLLLPGPFTGTPVATAGTVVAMVALTAGVIWCGRALLAGRGAPGAESGPPTSAVLGVVALGHIVAVVVGRVLADPLISMDARHLLPAWTLVVPALAIGITPSGNDPERRRARVALATCVVVVVVGSGIPEARSLRGAERVWPSVEDSRESSLLHALAAVPDDVVVVTNRPDLVYLLDGRPAEPLPVDLITGEVDPDYHAALRALVARVRDGGGVVVVFDGDEGWSVSSAAVADETGLPVISAGPDGRVLGCPTGCPGGS